MVSHSLVGVSSDLDTALDIGSFWEELFDTDCDPKELLHEANLLDKILGLKLLEYAPEEIKLTPELQKLLNERIKARDEKNYAESDRLRDEIKKLGYEVKDTPDGQRLEPR
jgi:cysteinyl-tRNA synthetase